MTSAAVALREIQKIDLVRLDPPPPPLPPPRWYRLSSLAAWARARIGPLTFVVLPTMLSAIYLFFLAADRYQTDARFVVKNPGSAAGLQIAGLTGGTGVVASSEDAYIVHAFFKSRDAVRTLARDADLVARLQRSGVDFLWGYPGFLGRPSDEKLWRHFQNFLSIDFDPGTGITTLEVQAFRPDDAREIAEVLLKSAEDLLNAMGERAQREALRSAEKEVDLTRERARQALDHVTQFRRRTSLIDPIKTSSLALETITSLSVEIARARAELSELDLSSPDSPQASTLRRRIRAFEHQIGLERAALAGTDTSLAPILAEYERLMLEREFAERTFSSSLTALEVARIDAVRQRLYIERISTASLVDYPEYPRRFWSLILVFVICYVLFSIGRALVGNVIEHAGK